jgi:hypothetical protein
MRGNRKSWDGKIKCRLNKNGPLREQNAAHGRTAVNAEKQKQLAWDGKE